MVTKVKSSEFQFARRRDPCVYLATANIPPCKSSNPFPFLSPFPFHPFGLFFFLYYSLRVAALLSLKKKKKKDDEGIASIDSPFFLSRLSCINMTRPRLILREQSDDYEYFYQCVYLSVRSIIEERNCLNRRTCNL